MFRSQAARASTIRRSPKYCSDECLCVLGSCRRIKSRTSARFTSRTLEGVEVMILRCPALPSSGRGIFAGLFALLAIGLNLSSNGAYPILLGLGNIPRDAEVGVCDGSSVARGGPPTDGNESLERGRGCQASVVGLALRCALDVRPLGSQGQLLLRPTRKSEAEKPKKRHKNNNPKGTLLS